MGQQPVGKVSTIPKTPSETRGQKNLKSQIEAALGLQTVKKGA